MKRKPPPASQAIQELEPYVSARMLHALDQEGTYLDANEAPKSFDFPPIDLQNIRHYADDKTSLEEAYAAYIGRPADEVLAMRGIDEAVDLIIRAFCEPRQDHALTFVPTYGGYAAAAAAHRVELRRASFDKDGTFDVGEAAASGARVIFLCRPNNPTASLASIEEVEKLAQSVPDRTVIAVDEAYIEFTEHPSAIDLLADCSNLIIMRTMSKAFGLAGAHVGYTVAHPQLTLAMAKIINPYPLADPCIQLAREALSAQGLDFLDRAVAENARVRDHFMARLGGHPDCLEVLPSQTSFVTARFENADAIHNRLREEKIFIRPLAPMYGESGWLRFTVGTEADMARILAILHE